MLWIRAGQIWPEISSRLQQVRQQVAIERLVPWNVIDILVNQLNSSIFEIITEH